MRCPVVYPFPSAEAYLWLPAMLWWISPAAGVFGGSVESFLVVTSDWRAAGGRGIARVLFACSRADGAPTPRCHPRRARRTTFHRGPRRQVTGAGHPTALLATS